MKPESEARAQFESDLLIIEVAYATAAMNLGDATAQKRWEDLHHKFLDEWRSLQAAYAAGAADEREACLQIAKRSSACMDENCGCPHKQAIVEAIRARQQTGEQTGKG